VSVQFIPLSGCLANATQQQTAFAASLLHLFQSSFVPTPSNVLADYTAAEADYTGYEALEMTTWNAPILSPGSGFMIQSPEVQFSTGDTTPATGNLIGGCYLVDSTGALRITIIFASPIPMQLAYQGIPINIVYLFPTGE
jgi:hypothetical protein